jgi:hypothetical protein
MTSDGLTISQRLSHFRHITRMMLQLTVGIGAQVDPSMLFRVDSDQFLSAFSCVVDGERIRAPSWDLAPGWTGDDVKIGQKYAELLQSSFGVDTVSELALTNPEALTRLWNSDNHATEHPFNKPQITEKKEAWVAHSRDQMRGIPVCVVNGEMESLERFRSKRRGKMDSARNTCKKKRKRAQVEVEEGECSRPSKQLRSCL